jgi:hypothetical protein
MCGRCAHLPIDDVLDKENHYVLQRGEQIPRLTGYDDLDTFILNALKAVCKDVEEAEHLQTRERRTIRWHTSITRQIHLTLKVHTHCHFRHILLWLGRLT